MIFDINFLHLQITEKGKRGFCDAENTSNKRGFGPKHFLDRLKLVCSFEQTLLPRGKVSNQEWSSSEDLRGGRCCLQLSFQRSLTRFVQQVSSSKAKA